MLAEMHHRDDSTAALGLGARAILRGRRETAARRPMDDDDFERLYTAHAQSLFAFLLYRTGDRVLAEDVMADTFERALHARRRFDRRRGSEKTWLYSIALNRLRDRHRRGEVEHRALEQLGGAAANTGEDGRLAAVEHRDLVQRAMTALSAEEREAISLRYGADLTVPEIAELLGESLTTVEGRVYRALRKLRRDLA
jgi:RNA polymerase sigma factor (sigma-70 family)